MSHPYDYETCPTRGISVPTNQVKNLYRVLVFKVHRNLWGIVPSLILDCTFSPLASRRVTGHFQRKLLGFSVTLRVLLPQPPFQVYLFRIPFEQNYLNLIDSRSFLASHCFTSQLVKFVQFVLK